MLTHHLVLPSFPLVSVKCKAPFFLPEGPAYIFKYLPGLMA